MLNRHDLTDPEWALLEPLLPSGAGRRGRPWVNHRQVVNAVLWRTRAGCPWRDLPAEFGSWKTVYNRHRRWSADGTWQRVLDVLRAGSDGDAKPGEWVVGVDSTVVRAHQHAAGARHQAPRDVPSAAVLTGGWVELQGSTRSA